MADGLEKFEEDLKGDPKLAEQFDQLVDQIKQSEETISDGEVITQAATELGYSFTIGDLERAIAEKQDLDLDELDQVAGGKYRGNWDADLCNKDYVCVDIVNPGEDDDKHDDWCGLVWFCLVVYTHTDDGTGTETCLKDNQCIWWNN